MGMIINVNGKEMYFANRKEAKATLGHYYYNQLLREMKVKFLKDTE